MSHPIFIGRTEIDFMTNFLHFSFFRAKFDPDYNEGLFTSTEETKAKSFLYYLEYIKKILLEAYNEIKKQLASPSKNSIDLLNSVDTFMKGLHNELFHLSFIEKIPTKRSYEHFLYLLCGREPYTKFTFSKRYRLCYSNNQGYPFSDDRDSFSCMEDRYWYPHPFPEERDAIIKRHDSWRSYFNCEDGLVSFEMGLPKKTVVAEKAVVAAKAVVNRMMF